MGNAKKREERRTESKIQNPKSKIDAVAAVLAGGLGIRLRPAVGDLPKVMADVAGRPFLLYVLDHLAASGIEDVVLCTGHMAEQIAALGDSYAGMRLLYSREESPLGTAGALRLALPLLASEHVLVLNGDSVCTADLTAFWQWHCAKAARGSILLVEVSDTSRYGSVEVDADGCVAGYTEKGGKAHPGWVNAGVYLLTHALLDTIPEGRPVSIEREMFPLWSGRGLYGCQSEGTLLDIGTPESYAKASGFLEDEEERMKDDY